MHENKAIILATFGTTVETAVSGLLSMCRTMSDAFPGIPVTMAFTSNQIRWIWQRRARDPVYLNAHPDIPGEILKIQGVLAAIANLQDRGVDTLIVQPTHIVPAEEFHDLGSYIRGLTSITTMKPKWRPFKTIALGRPLLGSYHLQRPYSGDIRRVAEALSEDAALARDRKAALVYMGHGNRFFPSGGLYLEFAARMRQLYPDVLTLIATAEGFPALDDILTDLRHHEVRRVILKPFLLVAGEHASRDLAGPEEDSWLSRLTEQGFEVTPVLAGLNENPDLVQILIDHAAEAAADAGVELP
ncbi:MAG: sirohydrochlorin cobaltochelatase [Desulfobulbus sp.]|nr:sirohydrochlorin cobaltochelatase [Desulfobulbus sp.]